jgi:hypothetical protein
VHYILGYIWLAETILSIYWKIYSNKSKYWGEVSFTTMAVCFPIFTSLKENLSLVFSFLSFFHTLFGGLPK